MYGKWVVLQDNTEVICKVFVWCTPTTPQEELVARAKEILMSKIGLA